RTAFSMAPKQRPKAWAPRGGRREVGGGRAVGRPGVTAGSKSCWPRRGGGEQGRGGPRQGEGRHRQGERRGRSHPRGRPRQGGGPRPVGGRGRPQGGGGRQAERPLRREGDRRGPLRQGGREPRRGRRHGAGEDLAVIAPMDQVTVVGRRSVARDVLAALQALGVVQVVRLTPDEEERALRGMRLEGAALAEREAWERVLARTTALLDVRGLAAPQGARATAVPDAASAEAEVREVGEQVDRLVAERAELRDELELIETYLPLMRDLAPMLAQVEASRYLAGIPFLAAESDLEDLEAKLRSEFG